jgi:glycolate oxidase
VVLPTGEIIWTGANVLKNSTGYNLTALVVGSEGTLGIVTKIVLKLLPLPRYDLLMLVPFRSLEKAGEAVSAIFRAGFVPSALELVEVDALRITARYLESVVDVPVDIEAHLLIEVDGNDPEKLMTDMEAIAEVLEGYGAGEDILLAEDAAQKAETLEDPAAGRGGRKERRLYDRRRYGGAEGRTARAHQRGEGAGAGTWVPCGVLWPCRGW